MVSLEVAEQRVGIAGAEVGHLEHQERSRESPQVPEHEGKVARKAQGSPGGLWQVKQQRAALFPAGPSSWLSPESLQEGRKGSGWDSM